MSITGAQVRMARAALCLSMAQVQDIAGVSERTQRRVERSHGVPAVSPRTLTRLRTFYQDRGLLFLDGDQPGVRFAYDPSGQLDCASPARTVVLEDAHRAAGNNSPKVNRKPLPK